VECFGYHLTKYHAEHLNIGGIRDSSFFERVGNLFARSGMNPFRNCVLF
jgi:hypothetical protein